MIDKMPMLIQELELFYVIPAVRREFALELLRRGVKQVDIAEKLHVSKAAVSQYLSNARAGEMKFNSYIKKEIKKAVNNIINEKNSINELQKIIALLRNKKITCEFHIKKEKVEKECDLCFRDVKLKN